MFCVTSRRIAFEVDKCSLHKPRQDWSKVLSVTDGTHPMQIVRRPDDTGRAPVEAGIAVSHALVTWVERPERVGVEIGHSIGGDFLDRSPDSQFIPGVMCQRTMTTEVNHGLSAPGTVYTWL
jgi:hypothetical protein